MESSIKDFSQLIDEMARGSEEAAWELAERYTPHIIRAVRASLKREIRSKIDSQDFAQIVWASILLKRSQLVRFENSEQFMGYLAAVARNKVIDAYRNLRSQKRNIRTEVSFTELELGEFYVKERILDQTRDAVPNSKEPSPSQVAIVREVWKALIKNCSARDRQIISLRVKGLYYGQIADKLSIGEKTVRRVLGRLLEQLQE